MSLTYIDKLEGDGYQIGVTIAALLFAIPMAIGGDFNVIPDSEQNTSYYGVTTNVGFGTPGAEVHAEKTKTTTLNNTRFNIFNILNALFSIFTEE